MVGPPKHLSDLHKIEADVRIICRRCRFEDDWTVADLSTHLFAIGGSTVWSEVTRHLRCRRAACGSSDLRALPVPFARRQANLPRQVGKLDAALIEAAMAVLVEATGRGSGSQATVELRLALLVLHRYVRDRELLRATWAQASGGEKAVWQTLQASVHAIRVKLVREGWLPSEAPTREPRRWPWSSPAPRGWLVSPSCPEHEPEEHWTEQQRPLARPEPEEPAG